MQSVCGRTNVNGLRAGGERKIRLQVEYTSITSESLPHRQTWLVIYYFGVINGGGPFLNLPLKVKTRC